MTGEVILAVAQRELDTVVRTRLMAVLAAGYFLLTVGLALLVSSGSYIGVVLDTLLPTEALVTVLVFAMGYRTVVGDRERGELDRLRTYPLSRWAYVVGVYLGRAVPVVTVILLALVGAGGVVALTAGGGPSLIATHATADSPLLFFRYAVLTVVLGLVGLAVAILVSASARSTRAALVLTAVAVLVLIVGLDAGLIAALSGGIVSSDGLTWLLAVSPTSAYRALVLELCVAPIGASIPAGPGVLPSVAGLGLWLGVSLAAASRLAWR